MKICLLGNATSLHLQRWALWFAGKGHEVHIITFVDTKIKNVNIHYVKIKVKHLPFSHLLSLPLNIQQVKGIIKEISPDIVNGQYLTNYGLYAACTGFHPLVLNPWGSDVLITPKRFFIIKLLTKYSLKKAESIICDSETVREGLLWLGAQPSKIRKIYNGIDTHQFNPQRKDEDIKNKLKVSGAPIIICFRGLVRVYNVEMLIKAIPLILKQVPEARFIIGGDGNQRDYLESLARSLGVSESVKFIGYIPHHELPKYLASSDVYVSTSLSDSTSLSLQEAMACELAPVVTDLLANREWVKNGENGFLVPVDDVPTLADRIIYLIRNKEIREKFGKESRRIIQERAEYGKEMEKMERIYQELLR